jgi:hypothetical protein
MARLFGRLESRVFRPAMAVFTSHEAVLPFQLHALLDRVDAQMDEVVYTAFPEAKTSCSGHKSFDCPSALAYIRRLDLGRDRPNQ